MDPKLELHAIQQRGCDALECFYIPVSDCPGPGNSWGNPAVPPASKDAERGREREGGVALVVV